MTDRRSFLVSAAAFAGASIAQPILGQVAGQKPLSRKERVDRALAGRDVDRPAALDIAGQVSGKQVQGVFRLPKSMLKRHSIITGNTRRTS